MTVSPESDVRGLGDTKMKELILGDKAGTGAAETLHIQENGCLGMIEGDWLWGAFKRKAKWLTRKNHLTREEWSLMEDFAIGDLLNTLDGYDPAKAKRGGRKGYLNTIIGNALGKAAQYVVDQRSQWSSRQSLDAAVGDSADSMTHVDRLMDGRHLAANEKFWGEPRCRVIRRKLDELKKDEKARKRLLARIAAQTVVVGDEDDEPVVDCPPMVIDLLGVDTDTLDVVETEKRETEHRTMEAMHGDAVAEMGLSEDVDEKVEASGGKVKTSGFGDCAVALFDNAVKLDVALVMGMLEPRLKAWCEKVMEGYSPTEAYRAVRFSKSNFYAYVLPKLKEAFKGLRYAL